jgi:hypothetical protein
LLATAELLASDSGMPEKLYTSTSGHFTGAECPGYLLGRGALHTL